MNIFKATVNSIFIALFLLLVSFSSCDPDPVEPINEGAKAGIYDASYIFHEYATPLEFQVTWDSVNLFAKGEDSIDLDLDGKYDLQFKLDLLNKDSLYLLNGQTPIPFPNFCVNSINNVQIAVFFEERYIGLGTTTEIGWADTLSYQERVNEDVKWLEPQYCQVKLWGENPYPGGFSFGGWYALNSIKYIGVRMNNKYGWIEIDTTNPNNPKIISYAIQE